MVEQLTITGLIGGSIYALLALSLVIVFTGTGVVNFAQGSFVTVGSYLIVATLADRGWPTPLAVVGAVAITTLLAGLIERVIIRRTFAIGELQAVVATVAILVIVESGVRLIWGPEIKQFPRFLPQGTTSFRDVTVSTAGLMVLGASALLALSAILFIRGTRIGLMMRATADNPHGAEVVGISIDRVRLVTWLVAGVLGAASGVLLGHVIPTTPEMGLTVLVKGFAGAILGGFTSLGGAITGALALGVLENFGAFYIDSVFKDGFGFVAIVVVLLLRPEGLFSMAKGRHV